MGDGEDEEKKEDDVAEKEKEKDEDAPAKASENGDASGDAKALLGEWKYVENVLTIVPDGDRTKIVTDGASVPLFLERDGEEWVAKKKGSSKSLYTVAVDGDDTLTMKKGDQTFEIKRCEKTKSLLGEWVHKDKSLTVEERTHGLLFMVSSGRPPLQLLRKQQSRWEASKEDTGDTVYHIEHTEGQEKITVIRPGASATIEFTRAGKENRSERSPVKEKEKERSRSRERERERDRDRDDDRRKDRDRSREKDPKSEDALQEFIKKYNLSQRVEDALRGLSNKEREYIVGFELKGEIRDPDAVIMSRIRKMQMDPPKGKGGGKGKGRGRDYRGGSRSRSRGRGRSRGRSSRSPSRRSDSRYSAYSYSYGYSDESSYSEVSVKKKKQKRKAPPAKASKKEKTKEKVKKDSKGKAKEKDRKKKR